MRWVSKRRGPAPVAPHDEVALRAWLEELAAGLKIPPPALRPPCWSGPSQAEGDGLRFQARRPPGPADGRAGTDSDRA